jgi:hypothetical protein
MKHSTRVQSQSNCSSLIHCFASAQRLRVVLDADGTPIILGRDGHIYEYSTENLAVMAFCECRPRFWIKMRRECLQRGMFLVQAGDLEGAFAFDPSNPDHSRLAIKLGGILRRRFVSSERRRELASRLRNTPYVELNVPEEGAPGVHKRLPEPRVMPKYVRPFKHPFIPFRTRSSGKRRGTKFSSKRRQQNPPP